MDENKKVELSTEKEQEVEIEAPTRFDVGNQLPDGRILIANIVVFAKPRNDGTNQADITVEHRIDGNVSTDDVARTMINFGQYLKGLKSTRNKVAKKTSKTEA